jgi:hypothetical protein
METNGGDHKTITHEFPVWRETSDFILAKRLNESDVPEKWKWEQIWARQILDNVFEICCIPFFSYGLALGDWVNTKPLDERKYVINDIVEKKGHTTYRVWFQSKAEWNSTIDEIQTLGCLVEVRWEKSGLIAIDAPNSTIREKLENFLRNLEETTLDIEWEIGI